MLVTLEAAVALDGEADDASVTAVDALEVDVDVDEEGGAGEGGDDDDGILSKSTLVGTVRSDKD